MSKFGTRQIKTTAKTLLSTKVRLSSLPIHKMCHQTASLRDRLRNQHLKSRPMNFPSCHLIIAFTAAFTILELQSNANLKPATNGSAMVKAIRVIFTEVTSCGIWSNQIIRRSFFIPRVLLRSHRWSAICVAPRICSCWDTSQPKLRPALFFCAESRALARYHKRMTAISIRTIGSL